MSLLDETRETFVMLNKTTVKDGYGSFDTIWSEGAEFTATIVYNGGLEAQRASIEGVVGLYTVFIPRGTPLEYHSVFKRVSDGMIFRITEDDMQPTPRSSALDLAIMKAEEWSLPRE